MVSSPRGLEARLRRGVCLLAAFVLLCGFDPFTTENDDVVVGNARIKAGKPKEALKSYTRAAKSLPDSPGVHYNRGIALYKLGKHDDARKALLKATAARDRTLKRKAFFNLGNSFFQMKRWEGAIDAYRRALRIDPSHKASKWNLELALRELQKKKKKQQKKKNKKKKNKKNKKQQKQKQDQKKDQQKQKQDQKQDQQKQKQDQKKDQQKKQKKKQQSKKQQQKKKQQQQKKQKRQANKNKKQQKKRRRRASAPKKKKSRLQREIDRTLKALDKSDKNLQKRRLRRIFRRRRPVDRDW